MPDRKEIAEEAATLAAKAFSWDMLSKTRIVDEAVKAFLRPSETRSIEKVFAVTRANRLLSMLEEKYMGILEFKAKEQACRSIVNPNTKEASIPYTELNNLSLVVDGIHFEWEQVVDMGIYPFDFIDVTVEDGWHWSVTCAYREHFGSWSLEWDPDWWPQKWRDIKHDCEEALSPIILDDYAVMEHNLNRHHNKMIDCDFTVLLTVDEPSLMAEIRNYL